MTARKLPWYKRNPKDMLSATRQLTLEERAAFNDILDLLYLHDRPLADNPRFLSSFIGVSVRKWSALRQALLDAGKLIEHDGYLTNERFERERGHKAEWLESQQSWGQLGGKKRAATAPRNPQGQFDLSEGYSDENRSFPPSTTKGSLGQNHQRADKTAKTAEIRQPEPRVALEELDDSFLNGKPVSDDFHDVFSAFSADFRPLKNSENGSFPPASSKPARSRESASEVREEEKKISNSPNGESQSALLKPQHVVEEWNDLATELGRPPIRTLTPERRQLLKARIAQFSVEDFQTVFDKCRDSPFLRGDKGRTPLAFDWLFKKQNFQKTLEGNYDR
jgi:uncharacterized protein YdaU (DUF1376 family)